MNKEITSEKKYRHILKKNIPSLNKRESSIERKNLKIKKRIDSIKRLINNNTGLHLEHSNIKSSSNILISPCEKKTDSKKVILKNKKSNNKYSNKVLSIKNENSIKEKENNYKNINIILENKEKAKTFNRQGSNQKIKISNNNLKGNYSNKLYKNQKNSLLRVKSGAFKLNKKKLLCENKPINNTNNNINSNIKNDNRFILSHTEKTPVSDKRNTDNLILNKNKEEKNEINETNHHIHIKNQKNEKIFNKHNEKNIESKKNLNNNFSHTCYLNINDIKKIKLEENYKNEFFTSKPMKKNISPISIINNNVCYDINNIMKNMNKNNILEIINKRKNIDINLDYHQINSKNKKNSLNNTTSKVKLKSCGLMTNIEMDKNKEYLHLTENNSNMQSKSKSKIKYNNSLKHLSDNKNKNIILNHNNSNLPSFIRKCGSVNENKNTNFDKNKINKIFLNNFTEENKIYNSNKSIEPYVSQFDKTININDRYNQNENIINNDNTNSSTKTKNEQKNTNVESSFTTLNFINSNIDENNNNEPRNDFVHGLNNYNFMSNSNNNNEGINNINILYNNTISNSDYKNKDYKNTKIINNNGELKSNLNTIKKVNIPSISIINDIKNGSNNLLTNNNFSDCNTGNTSNNNNQNNINEKKMKENVETKNNNNDNIDKNLINKYENELTNKKTIKNDDNDNDNFNEYENKEKNKKDILKNKILNKKQIEDKDLSLDKSTSLRMFPIVHEDFIDKEDEVIKLLNFQSPRESSNDEESEIIFQNSDYSKEIPLLINNDYWKYNNLVNNKSTYQNLYNSNNNYNSLNLPNLNINVDNVGLKDTSIISNIGIKGCKSITQAGKERIGRRKKNQDFYIIEKNINNILGFNLFGILDGHGVNGHMASQFASKLLIKKFTNIASKFNDTESVYNYLKKSDFQNIIDIFLEIDKQIMDQKGFDITLSGTTCCLVIQLYEHIICSNIGDSRAILIFDDKKIFELSHDSKPEVPEETKRINLMGGIVDQVENGKGEKTGPYRVYIKDMDQPGLAMSRSFGDKKAKFCGVIPYPDIIEYNLNNDSKYMVICSDGVWEFLSNEEVMEIGNKYYGQNNINEFCSQLLKKSTEMWESEENYIDDITIVTVFFN